MGFLGAHISKHDRLLDTHTIVSIDELADTKGGKVAHREEVVCIFNRMIEWCQVLPLWPMQYLSTIPFSADLTNCWWIPFRWLSPYIVGSWWLSIWTAGPYSSCINYLTSSTSALFISYGCQDQFSQSSILWMLPSECFSTSSQYWNSWALYQRKSWRNEMQMSGTTDLLGVCNVICTLCHVFRFSSEVSSLLIQSTIHLA